MRYRLRTLLIAVSLLCLALCVWRNRDYIPGTLRWDPMNRPGLLKAPKGTGVARHYYRNGAVRDTQWILAGVVKRISWYRPDGSHIATSWFDATRGGTGY